MANTLNRKGFNCPFYAGSPMFQKPTYKCSFWCKHGFVVMQGRDVTDVNIVFSIVHRCLLAYVPHTAILSFMVR